MNAPIIDLSLLTPQQMMAQKGQLAGSVYVLWFRLLRPSLVGAVWAAICIYAYRYLLPFNQSEMPVEQLTFYLSGIGCIATGFVLWMIASRVAHPFMRRPIATPPAASGEIVVEARRAQMRAPAGDFHTPRILIASHDSTGAVSAITSNVIERQPRVQMLYAAVWRVPVAPMSARRAAANAAMANAAVATAAAQKLD